MTTPRPCRSANPTTCPYHGALLRMRIAEEKKDVAGYFDARDEAEAAAATTNKGLKGLFQREDVEPLPEVNHAVFDDEDEDDFERYDDEYWDDVVRLREEERAAFLEESAAIPTPMEAYALWLSVYAAQGGEFDRVKNSSYRTRAAVLENGAVFDGQGEPLEEDTVIAYDDLAWNAWTPTKTVGFIPEGYGASSLNLFIMPDVVPQNLTPSSGDSRDGWEWGHTNVFVLRRDTSVPLGLVAWTNAKYVRTYSDVERYRNKKSVKQMVETLMQGPAGSLGTTEKPALDD